MPGRIYTCASCGEDFESGWSEEEARAEAEANFSPAELADTAVVCDDCYAEIMAFRDAG